MTPGIVQAEGLTKRYGSRTAVDSMDLSVAEGEVYGFLGPNGSGKTTSILMFLGLTEPTSGTARVCGFDSLREPLGVKRLASYLPENVGFYTDLTARQNLRYTADLNHLPRAEAKERIEQLLGQVGLTDDADRQVGQFSRGMRQRLGIADALVKRPRVAFLDDPTIGLDPEGVRELLELIVSMSRDQGITIFLSSHLLHQVQRICDRIGIMFRGSLVAQGTVEELATSDGDEGVRIEVEVVRSSPELARALEGLDGVREATATGDHMSLDCERDVRPQVAEAVLQQGAELLSLKSEDRTLEDIYLRYFRRSEEEWRH